MYRQKKYRDTIQFQWIVAALITSELSILTHGIIVLTDSMSYDKNIFCFVSFFSSSKLSEASLLVLFWGCCLLSPFQSSPSASAAVSVAARTVEGPRVDMTLKGPLVCGWCVLHFYWYLPHWCCKLVVSVSNWIVKSISQELINP